MKIKNEDIEHEDFDENWFYCPECKKEWQYHYHYYMKKWQGDWSYLDYYEDEDDDSIEPEDRNYIEFREPGKDDTLVKLCPKHERDMVNKAIESIINDPGVKID